MAEAPFSNTQHVFQNLSDGTYNHSGVQAIRAALEDGTTNARQIAAGRARLDRDYAVEPWIEAYEQFYEEARSET